MVAVTVEAFPGFDPSPRAGITITGLGVTDSVVSVWRTADGERNPVRGARRAVMNDAAYVIDYDVPLGRPVSYEVEVISGPSVGSRVTSSSVTVDADSGYIMDPLFPQSAVQIARRLVDGQPAFAASAMAKLDYAADVQVFKILGSDRPMALFGQRMAAAGVDFSLITDAAEQNTRLRSLLSSAGLLLVRVPLSWTDVLPGSWFAAVSTASESPIGAPDEAGDVVTAWDLSGDTVAAPTLKVLTATFTYGDVALLFATYQQKQDAATGSYLDDLKNPLG
jgi:hypothetical protein